MITVPLGRLSDREVLTNFLTFKGNSPTWYLPCFLLVLALFSVIEQVCSKRDLAIMLIVLCGMLALFLPHNGFVSFSRIGVGLIFFVAGYYLYPVFLAPRSWTLIALESIMYLIFTWINGYVDLWNMALSNQLLYFCNALIGMHVCLQVSLIMEASVRLNWLKTVISTFGQHSLFILCTHWIFIGIVMAAEQIILGDNHFTHARRITREVIGVERTIVVLILNYMLLICFLAFKNWRIRQKSRS